MKAKLGAVIVTLAIATGVMVSTAAPALANQCGGKTISSLRRCINTRVAAQHNQIVKLQAKVKSLSLTVTTQALALRVNNLTTTVHNQGNTLSESPPEPTAGRTHWLSPNSPPAATHGEINPPQAATPTPGRATTATWI